MCAVREWMKFFQVESERVAVNMKLMILPPLVLFLISVYTRYLEGMILLCAVHEV